MYDLSQVMDSIVHADCMEFMKEIPDNSIDCIFTDVPYKTDFHGKGRNSLVRGSYERMLEYGTSKKQEYNELFAECLRVLRRGTVNFFTFCDAKTRYALETIAIEKRLNYSELVWCKTSPAPFCNNQWLSDKEYGIHIYKGLPVRGDYHTKRSWSVMNNFKEPGIDHPTPKKVGECMRILNNITDEGQVVLDPFSGSGTTAVACHRLGLHYICVEKDEKYWADSVERLNQEKQEQDMFGYANIV